MQMPPLLQPEPNATTPPSSSTPDGSESSTTAFPELLGRVDEITGVREEPAPKVEDVTSVDQPASDPSIEPKLVGDGGWFWHPGEQAIRGFLFAEGMGIDLFEYTSRWEGDSFISELATRGWRSPYAARRRSNAWRK